MASIRRDTGGGNSLPQSEVTPQPHLSEHDRADMPLPPQSMPEVSVLRWIRICLERDEIIFEAALPAHCYSLAPQWNTPTPHSSVLDQRYRMVPYVGDIARNHNVWTNPQQSVPFAPVKAMASITPSWRFKSLTVFFSYRMP